MFKSDSISHSETSVFALKVVQVFEMPLEVVFCAKVPASHKSCRLCSGECSEGHAEGQCPASWSKLGSIEGKWGLGGDAGQVFHSHFELFCQGQRFRLWHLLVKLVVCR